MSNLIQQEIQSRQQIKDQIFQMIFEVCNNDDGYVQRGCLQRYLWEKLEMKGRPSNQFARFLNRILLKNGYRSGFHAGMRCYYGLSWKDINTPLQFQYHKVISLDET